MKGPSLLGSVAHGMVGGFGAGVGIEELELYRGMSGSNSQDNVQQNQTLINVYLKKSN